jgi:hypothetical protein
MTSAHSAPWRGESRAGDCPTQVVIRVAVAPRKMRAGDPENGLDLSGGCSLREQVFGDPEIHDAPVRLRKALENVPSLDTTVVNGGGFGHYPIGWDSRLSDRTGAGPRGWFNPLAQWLCQCSDRLQQRIGTGSQTSAGVYDFHPRSVAAWCAPPGLLVGEPGESSQMAPVGAGQIPAIGARQLLAGSGCQSRLQRRVLR